MKHNEALHICKVFLINIYKHMTILGEQKHFFAQIPAKPEGARSPKTSAHQQQINDYICSNY